MLYSLNYKQNGRKERRLFYAEDDTEAEQMVRIYAERNGLLNEVITLLEHPGGMVIESKLFPRFLPPEEKKKKRTRKFSEYL